MTISDDERGNLIKYRIEQAHEAIEEVRFLIDNDKLKLAVNRIYYGMFYILSVLALKHKLKRLSIINLSAGLIRTPQG